MNLLCTIRLFLQIVGRDWEPKSCGIPEPYRIHYRISPIMAWRIAWTVHMEYRHERP